MTHPAVLLTSVVKVGLLSVLLGTLQSGLALLLLPQTFLYRQGPPFPSRRTMAQTLCRRLPSSGRTMVGSAPPARAIPKTQHLQGILLAAALLALGLASALAWQCTLILLAKASLHRVPKTLCSLLRIRLWKHIRHPVERQDVSLQGPRLTLLMEQWHLLQLGRASLTPAIARVSLPLSVAQLLLVFSRLALLEVQEALDNVPVRLSLSAGKTESIVDIRK